MSMSIGKKIKELRRAQDVTQEKLAEYLNLSYQAVSKWENEQAYPDITLVPSLANFFGVSADELLGMKGNEDNEELKAYAKEHAQLHHVGKIAEAVELCREVLKKYPRNYNWISELANSINFQKDKSREDLEEVITLCERLLEDCNEGFIRSSAIQLLVYSYCDVGNRERAIEVAKTMPEICISSESLLASAYEGEDMIRANQNILLTCIWMCELSLTELARSDEKLSFDEKVACHETAIKLYDIIFQGNENALFYNVYISTQYRYLAKLHGENGMEKEALAYLLCAEKSTEMADKNALEGKQSYKSFLLNRQFSNPSESTKNYEETTSGLLRNFTKYECFDSLRELPEFITLMSRLEAAK